MLMRCRMQRLALVAAIAACATPESAPEPAPFLILPVIKSKPRELTAIVVSQAAQIVTAQIEGRVRMFIGPGDAVHAGDVIAELDDAELRAEIAHAQEEEA